MKIFIVSEDRNSDPILCLTLEIAQRIAKGMRDKIVDLMVPTYYATTHSDVTWENQLDLIEESTLEVWYLMGTRTKADGINEVGCRYLLGPVVVIYTDELIEV